jgi:hypothetical protein
MKSVKSVLFVLGMALLTPFVNAKETPNFKSPESAQIQKMLVQVNELTNNVKEMKINISFLVNGQNEIIVLSTNNEEFDSLIKSALNYKKISVSELDYNTVYTLPVTFK